MDPEKDFFTKRIRAGDFKHLPPEFEARDHKLKASKSAPAAGAGLTPTEEKARTLRHTRSRSLYDERTVDPSLHTVPKSGRSLFECPLCNESSQWMVGRTVTVQGASKASPTVARIDLDQNKFFGGIQDSSSAGAGGLRLVHSSGAGWAAAEVLLEAGAVGVVRQWVSDELLRTSMVLRTSRARGGALPSTTNFYFVEGSELYPEGGFWAQEEIRGKLQQRLYHVMVLFFRAPKESIHVVLSVPDCEKVLLVLPPEREEIRSSSLVPVNRSSVGGNDGQESAPKYNL